MNLIKPSAIALAILGLGALVAIAGKPKDAPPSSSCAANKRSLEPNLDTKSDGMPPDLCDRAQRCSCESNVLPGNDQYCVRRMAFGWDQAETFSLACIDHWRYCERAEMRLCYKGSCEPDAQENRRKCIMPIESIGRSP